jgi:hypothetical protein
MDSKPEENKSQYSTQDAGARVAEAHGLLKKMKEQRVAHPELDLAIEKLEMALSILTTNTGGML